MHKLPLILFIVLAVFFATLLLKGKDPAEIPSAMVGRAVPVFELPPAFKGQKGFSSHDLQRAPTIVNVFASWCLSCQLEQRTFIKIMLSSCCSVNVYGIAYKDTAQKLAPWLKKHGNPYKAIGNDPEGQAAIDWGVTGVPETFIVDAKGIIRYKHIGPVTDEVYETIFKPMLAEMKR